jgi:hypothetical protein
LPAAGRRGHGDSQAAWSVRTGAGSLLACVSELSDRRNVRGHHPVGGDDWMRQGVVAGSVQRQQAEETAWCPPQARALIRLHLLQTQLVQDRAGNRLMRPREHIADRRLMFYKFAIAGWDRVVDEIDRSNELVDPGCGFSEGSTRQLQASDPISLDKKGITAMIAQADRCNRTMGGVVGQVSDRWKPTEIWNLQLNLCRDSCEEQAQKIIAIALANFPEISVQPIPYTSSLKRTDHHADILGSETAGAHLRSGDHDGRDLIEVRLGFGLDIVGYSSRSKLLQDAAQRRLSDLVENVLAEQGLSLRDTDHQGTGDGMNVFLPWTVNHHQRLADLMSSLQGLLRRDNRLYRDRMRLRMSVAFGPMGPSALGFNGESIIEISRLLDSAALREVVASESRRDIAMIISDTVYKWFVTQEYPGLEPGDFTPVQVELKEYRQQAWLWNPVAAPQASASNQSP